MIKFERVNGQISINLPVKMKESVIEKIDETSSFNFVSFEKVRRRCIIRLEQAQNPSVTIDEIEDRLKDIFNN